ncbi:HEAT repeat domain-containing protein [Tundrisphaera lichenicola]|uniref:HEAT repeat domain-containing protein n=1 Tax=Tundrisphaera lichenicola TaxID=2029860 RepID=UPI003EB916AC
MAITFHCESCGKRFDVDEGLAGKRAKCKQCGLSFVIPGATFPVGKPRSPHRAMPPSHARPADPPPRGHDPFGFEEPPAPLPPRHADRDEEFEEVMPRRATMKPTKAAPPSHSGAISIAGLPAWGYLLLTLALGIGMAFVMSQASNSSMQVAALAVQVLVMVVSLGGGIACMVVAFRESVACGLMYLFVPFYSLYYLCTRWDEMKKPFVISIGGVAMGLGFALFLPAFFAASGAAERARMNNEQVAAGQLAQAPFPIIGQEPGHERDPGLQQNIARAPLGALTPPPAESAPGETVTVIVSGITDEETGQHVGDQIGEILKESGKPWRSEGGGGLGQRTYRVSPVGDPEEFARKITFGKVQRVTGRSIEVVANAVRPSGPRPAADDFAGQVRFDLESPVLQKRKEALARLMRAAPGEGRQEVAKAVEPMLKDPDGFARSDAAKTLAVWGGPENTHALIEALKDPEFHVRWAVLDTLKALKDPESADALADYFMDSNDRGKAVEALKAIGPPAEDAVLRCLNHNDGFTRMDACKILEQIGTEKSVPALRRLAMTNQGLDSMAARDALKRLGNGRGR